MEDGTFMTRKRKNEEDMYGGMARTVDHEQCARIMELHARIKRPLFIKGPPGIGKSDLVRQVGMAEAERMGLEYVEFADNPTAINDLSKYVLIDLRLAQLDPSDLRGIPWVYAIIENPDTKQKRDIKIGKGKDDAKEGEISGDLEQIPVSLLSQYDGWEILQLVTRWSPPSDLPIRGHGMIFLDEMNLAAELNMKAAYQLILRRCLGEYKVPDGYAILAAGNRIDDMASVTPMPAPLKSRFDWVELRSPSVEQWTDWASGVGVHPWIIGYLNYKTVALDMFDPQNPVDAQPCPRTWAFASDILNDIGTNNLEDVRLMLATAVGIEHANEVFAFIKMREQLPPISEYIRDPMGARIDFGDTAIVWTLLSALSEKYKSSLGTKQEAKVLNAVLKFCYRIVSPDVRRPEFAVVFLGMLKSVDKDMRKKVESNKVFLDIADELVVFVGQGFSK